MGAQMSDAIQYVEFPASNIEATKAFFSECFNWQFQDYGDEYTAFSNSGLEGGFFKSEQASLTKNGSALVVFYSDDILATLERVRTCGGEIVKAIFEFPGGCRFHFCEPSGNELAVWSDKVPESY
jgi:predicted enzyme related to lactoylglutathione lyase